MPIQADWLDDTQRTVVLTFGEEWTAGELLDAMDIESEMVRDLPYAPDVIADFSATTRLPEKLIANMPEFAEKSPRNIRRRVVVSVRNRALNRVARIFSKVYTRLIFVDTFEDALYVLDKSAEEQE